MRGPRLLAAVLLLAACSGGGARHERPADATDVDMNSIAEDYVRLVLELGRHDEDYVDAYYGPPEWAEQAQRAGRGVAEIRARAEQLAARLRQTPAPPAAADAEAAAFRRNNLLGQLEALGARARMLGGERASFDAESLALYGAAAPALPEGRFDEVLEQLAAALPGAGTLAERYDAFHDRFVVPRERFDAVYRAAIDGCRKRTLAHIDLPADESFEVEYVTGKPWSAYNWYKGGHRSVIQVNVDEPIHIDRAIELACHEGYPGHHVYNVLAERYLVEGRGWVEFSIYPLYSPQSLIAEGSAEYGIELAFPGDERLAFERDTLFPLAGLDPALAERQDRVRRLVERLGYAGIYAARRYLDGEIDAAATTDWLVDHALLARPLAERKLRFFDSYRSYIINYDVGRDEARARVEAAAGTGAGRDRQWREFVRLLIGEVPD